MQYSRLIACSALLSLALSACTGDNVVEVKYADIPGQETAAVDSVSADSVVALPDSATIKPDTSAVAPDTATVDSAKADTVKAEPVKPLRVGPVSQYGQLQAGKNKEGMGYIYGSCDGVADGKEVQVRGMSLYWSIKKDALEFYTEKGVNTMVKEMNIEVLRLAEATEELWGDAIYGYPLDPDGKRPIIKEVVEAAVKNDIYVIIDWHSHNAELQMDYASEFFEDMAKNYGHLDNVIFEIYNEPKGGWGIAKANDYWPEIKTYADSIIKIIRKYSDNLIVVGNPFFSQYPNVALKKPIDDKNVAYTFHYYANSHAADKEGKNVEEAIEGGYSVFITEWGTGNADGKGTPSTAKNEAWQEWVDSYKLSWANWSASRIDEGTAAFKPESSADSLIYTASGEMVKSFLEKTPKSYTACPAK